VLCIPLFLTVVYGIAELPDEISITENEANIIICGEVLNIKGTNLTADKLSLEQGEIVILGNITSLKYEQKKEKQSLITNKVSTFAEKYVIL
jgi:hypothetical protein